MIKKLKRTLIVVGMFVLMMGIGTNIQVKADTLRQVKSIKTKTTYKYYKGIGNACGGNVAVTEYSSPGSVEMGMDVVKYLGDSLAVILAHHGVMTVGKNLKQALTAAVYLEETAKGYLAARACGEIEHLSDEQIKQTVEIYKYVGQGTADMPEGLTDRIK